MRFLAGRVTGLVFFNWDTYAYFPVEAVKEFSGWVRLRRVLSRMMVIILPRM